MPQPAAAGKKDDEPLVTLQVHEAAELFPLIVGQAFDDLVENIKVYGLRDPIVRTTDGKILDGRNRYRARLAAGVEPTFRTWRGPGKALSVRHQRQSASSALLDTSQRALIAATIATLLNRAPDRPCLNEAMSQPEAAALLNVSRASVQRATEVVDKGTPELVDAVRDGVISVGAASAVADLEPEAQKDVVRKVKGGVKPATILKKKRTTSTIEPMVTLPPPPPSTYEWVDERLTTLRTKQRQILDAYTELDACAPGLSAAERRRVRDLLMEYAVASTSRSSASAVAARPRRTQMMRRT